jgi:hypothetical protein
MAYNENKDSTGNLMDKLRSFLGVGDQKNKSALAPRKRLNIWYFLFAMLFFYRESGDDFLQ